MTQDIDTTLTLSIIKDINFLFFVIFAQMCTKYDMYTCVNKKNYNTK